MEVIQKICLLLLLLVGFQIVTANAQPSRNCGTMNGYQERLSTDPVFRANEAALLQRIRSYVSKLNEERAEGLRSTIITIPVIVHVVYNTPAENVSDAQIKSQIDVLNRDFRALNGDISSVPNVFKPLIADARIQFELAKRDPKCAATTGILRTKTSVTSFGYNPKATTGTVRNPVKFKSTGGDDAWASDKYLNLWVCNLGSSILGYASFPSDLVTRPLEDGVVIDYRAFGTLGTAAAPFNLGRTATHEIGHWLDLRHIWGDDLGACTGSDDVADTPNAAKENYGCPTFPHVSCGNSPNGDMFMNYMDYVDDGCMYMFSQGQSVRMDAALYTARASIASSQGAIAPSVAADLFMKDTGTDSGAEPNTTSTAFYQSDDIWIRHSNDGVLNQEHQNPIGGATNYVYVRVRNRGCATSGNATLKIYWAKASMGLGWPAPWDGSVVSPILMGGSIGSKSINAIKGGEFVIYEFAWSAPKPSDYISFGADKAHFCLLARIETSGMAPYGMTSAETGNLNGNVQNNNNIVWKNVTVVTPGTGKIEGQIILANLSPKFGKYRIVFETPDKEPSIITKAAVRVDYNSPAIKVWDKGPKVKKGLNADLVIQENGAYIAGIPMRPGELLPITLKFGEHQNDTNKQALFNFRALQYLEEDGGRLKFIGAENFVIKYKF